MFSLTRIPLFLLGFFLTLSLVSANPVFGAEDNLEELVVKEYLTKPTFGQSHENSDTVVDDGFKFNGKSSLINNNYHTPFDEQSVILGDVNSFEATVYAPKDLKVQEFLFGIQNIGEAHLAELGVEVWYGYDGEIENIKTIQKSNVIDENNVIATHEKTKCRASDIELDCDTTTVSIIFLEPLKDQVMAIKAIDYKNRYQITYLNDGFDISDTSLNPMKNFMIPSDIKSEGLVQVTQTEKYSPYWMAEDGRIFEKNNFGSFKQINKSFERFQDSGEPLTRYHSGFGGIIEYEKQRAMNIFNATTLLSQVSDSYSLDISIGERITEEMKMKMIQQEKIAQKNLEVFLVQARFH